MEFGPRDVRCNGGLFYPFTVDSATQRDNIPPPAPPAPAVAPKQAKIDAPPKPHKTIKPDYPKGARQRGEQGEVILEIRVNAAGIVDHVDIVSSCGFSELDEAAVRAA